MSDNSPVRLCFGDFEVDEGNARLTQQGQPRPITPKGLAVLCTLARRRGQLVTKNELLDAVWGHRHVSESVLKNTVSQLRGCLGDDARQPRFIETASRHGYRFIADATTPALQPPLPPAMQPGDAVAEAGWIGRAAALDLLSACWRRAGLGQRQWCGVVGDAGIGKSALVARFVAALGQQGAAWVLRGQCVQHYGSGEPFLPVLEALGPLLRRDPALLPTLRAVAPAWFVQLPWLSTEVERAALQRELAGIHPDRMLREGAEWLEHCARQRPLLMVIEDLHWSDQATLRLIEHMARRRTPARVMWLCTLRPPDGLRSGHGLDALRRELRTQGLAEEIELEPFSAAEVADFITQRFPSAADGDGAFAQALHAHTDGLPLFVVNVADALTAAEPTASDGRQLAARVVTQVPASLGGMIERQVGQLDVPTQGLLEAASVSGVEFSAGFVAGLLQQDEDAVAGRCDELVRRRQWLQAGEVAARPDGALDVRYRFRHAMYRHVVYRRLPAAARARLHRRAAAALAALRATGQPVAATELAVHHEQGHEPLAALRCFVEAAAGALGRFAPQEAAGLGDHALQVLARAAESPERLELELSLMSHRGMAYSMLHGFAAPQARAAFERALSLCDVLPQTPQRAWVLNGLGWALYARADYAGARALALRIADQATAADEPLLAVCAHNLMGITRVQQGELLDGRAELEHGLALCDALGERLQVSRFVIDPRVSMAGILGLTLAHLGLPGQARSRCAQALQLARAQRQPTTLLVALWCEGQLAGRLEEPDRVLEQGQAIEALSVQQGLASAAGPSRWMRGWALAQLGQPQAGHALVAEGYQWHLRNGRMAGTTHVLVCAADAQWRAGDLAAAQQSIDQVLQLAHDLGEWIAIGDAWLLQARIAHARGDRAAAHAALQHALADAQARQAQGQVLAVRAAQFELEGAAAGRRAALVKALDALPEKADTALERRARALLASSRSGHLPR